MANNLNLISAVFSSGESGFGQRLSGGYAQTGPNFIPQNTFTIEARVSSSNTGAIKVALAQLSVFWLGCDASGYAIVRYGSGGTDAALNTTVNICDGLVHHLELVFHSSGVNLYVDGVTAATSAVTLSAAGAQLAAGSVLDIRSFRGASSASFDWPGTVEEVAVWTTTRHTENFTIPSVPYSGLESGLYALWHLDGNGNDSAGISAATSLSVSGPTTGVSGTASSNFTVSANGALASPVVVTPSDGGGGGTFNPTSVTISTAATTATFTYTAGSAGAKSISVTNNGGLTNPSPITFTASAQVQAATAIQITGPTAGNIGVYGSDFTISVNGALSASVVVTPSDGGAGGSFSPATVTLTPATTTGTFRYQPSSAGTKSITVTNNGGLTNPSAISVAVAAGNTPKAPNDAGIVYSPYNWDVTSSAAKSINPGAYFKTIFSGSSCTLSFDMTNISSPVPKLLIRVDRTTLQRVSLQSSIAVTMPSGQDNSKHLLEVVFDSSTGTTNRWNSPQNAAVALTGILLASVNDTLSAPVTYQDKIICFGDSITEGVRTLSMNGATDVEVSSANVSWPLEMGRLLNAEVGVVGFGASGLNSSGIGNVPALLNSYAYLWSGKARNFSSPPKYCIWLEGTNDGSENTVSNGITALNGMLTSMPGTKFVIFRPLNGASQEANLQAIVSGCSDPSRAKYISTAGFWSTLDSSDNLHPYGYSCVSSIAPNMASAVQSAFPVATSGTQVPQICVGMHGIGITAKGELIVTI